MVKNSPDYVGDARDMGSVPGVVRSPGVGNGSPLQYSCLGNPLDRGAWQGTIHGVPQRVGHDLVTKQPEIITISSLEA